MRPIPYDMYVCMLDEHDLGTQQCWIVPEATVTCVQDSCMPCDMYSANYMAAV